MEAENVDIKRLDHWGIVAGMLKDLDIVELINSAMGTNSQEILTTGDIVGGIVINGLGFASRPLMLSPQFFENKELNLLIKNGAKAEHFNRHKIGRVLDSIANFGCEKLFNSIALSACQKEGVDTTIVHADTTSYELTGQYDSSSEIDENGNPIEYRVKITHGYSKANRPDLKQVIQEMIVSQDGGIPLMTQTLSGNASDSVILQARAKMLAKEFAQNGPTGIIADCKLYTKGTAAYLNKINYITLVPSKLKLAQKSVAEALQQKSDWITISDDYKYQEFDSDCYGIENQRWVIFYSQKSYERSQKILQKEVKREKECIQKEIFHLQAQKFSCESDARKKLASLAKNWRYHKIAASSVKEVKQYIGRGRPTIDTPYEIEYYIQATCDIDQEAFDKKLHENSCFILSTNFAKDALSAEQVLTKYKGQDKVEKGFAFLKKDEFFTSSLNLEKPGRIEALLMIMVLSLLIYSMAQRRLRKKLKELNETIPNQVNKQVKNPTMRWIFQLFEGIDFITIEINNTKKAFIKGINELRKKVINLLGGNTARIYQTSLSWG
jgi:transposase